MMTTKKQICANCGLEQDISTTADLMFQICQGCSSMGEWGRPEAIEAEIVEEVGCEEPESTIQDETEITTDLIIIEGDMSLADIWTPENVDAMIAKLEKYKNDFKGDVTTVKGRKAIISFSRKFSTSKILVDDMGKELIEEWQTKTKTVNTQRRKFKDACDKFRDESRKPVTDFENAEKLLVANQGRILARLVDLYNAAGDLDVATYEVYIVEVNAIVIDGDITSDFYTRGNREKEQTIASLEQKLAAKIQYNKDQADLAKLREAEEKRQAEETKKAQEKFAKANEKKIKLQAKKDADAKAAKKISEAKEAEEKAKREKKEAEEKAAREKKEAEEKADAEKKEAVAAAKKEANEKSVKKEKDRLAKIEEDRLADEKRAANAEHREKIKTESTRFIKGILGTSIAQADAIFEAMANGEVPHIEVKF